MLTLYMQDMDMNGCNIENVNTTTQRLYTADDLHRAVRKRLKETPTTDESPTKLSKGEILEDFLHNALANFITKIKTNKKLCKDHLLSPIVGSILCVTSALDAYRTAVHSLSSHTLVSPG